MTPYNFGPAIESETFVYGACRPAHSTYAPETTVDEWLTFMDEQGIKRVCCLLDDAHLNAYEDLIDSYRRHFGAKRVCHAPVRDFTVVSSERYHETIAPFLQASKQHGERVVVHCSAGQGRTGHVLALWVADEYDYGLSTAVEMVEAMGRAPREAATLSQLQEVLRSKP